MDLQSELQAGRCRLHVSTQDERAEYATLSYCWGDAQKHCLLTEAVLEEWKQEIRLEDLPRLVQDAVAMTTSLGIRYLWVDALCILQDNAEDKMQEIKRMGRIYKNSRVTIAAATSQGVSDSFIAPREELHFATLPFSCSDGRTGTVSLANRIYSHSPEQPLDRRGWALQEYLLSPRFLMFGGTELTWHCQTQVFKSIGESHIHYYELAQRLPTSIFDGRHPPLFKPKQKFDLWASIAQNYSMRRLTFPEDKLIAIAGIASELSRLWKDSYLYGCWGLLMIQCLGWRRSPNVKQNLPGSGPEQAPSWSWLSMNCLIQFYPEVRRVDALVVSEQHSTALACSGPGYDGSRSITLHAKLLSTENVASSEFDGWFIVYDFTMERLRDETLYYLLLGFSTRRNPVCLVLVPLADNIYRRVGKATHCYTEIWTACEPVTVTLV